MTRSMTRGRDADRYAIRATASLSTELANMPSKAFERIHRTIQSHMRKAFLAGWRARQREEKKRRKK